MNSFLANHYPRRIVRRFLLFLMLLVLVFFVRFSYLSMLANTLALLEDIQWLVIEDAHTVSPAVTRVLNSSGVPHTYFAARTPKGFPKKGWFQRDAALKFIREKHAQLTKGLPGRVYFADDDNSYSPRLFKNYIRKVVKAGVWTVGLVGGQLYEAPVVKSNKVVGWNAHWNPKRKFAIDMAGFALTLDLILNKEAVFGTSCKEGAGAPETCFLQKCGLTLDDLQPFGFDQFPREVLVWHTKTLQIVLRGRVPLKDMLIE